MDYSPLGSSVLDILQARILDWVAIPFSRGSSWPRDQTWVSRITGRFFFTIWATREALNRISNLLKGPDNNYFRFWGPHQCVWYISFHFCFVCYVCVLFCFLQSFKNVENLLSSQTAKTGWLLGVIFQETQLTPSTLMYSSWTCMCFLKLHIKITDFRNAGSVPFCIINVPSPEIIQKLAEAVVHLWPGQVTDPPRAAIPRSMEQRTLNLGS